MSVPVKNWIGSMPERIEPGPVLDVAGAEEIAGVVKKYTLQLVNNASRACGVEVGDARSEEISRRIDTLVEELFAPIIETCTEAEGIRKMCGLKKVPKEVEPKHDPCDELQFPILGDHLEQTFFTVLKLPITLSSSLIMCHGWTSS